MRCALSPGCVAAVGDTSWKWESSLFYNEVNGKDNASPDVRESLLAAAIAGTGGTYFNPFGYTFRVANNAVVVDQPYTNPQALVDSFSDTYRRTARSYLASADARANGRLVTLGPVDVQAAIGVEHRKEDLRDLRPPFHGENPGKLRPVHDQQRFHPAPGAPGRAR